MWYYCLITSFQLKENFYLWPVIFLSTNILTILRYYSPVTTLHLKEIFYLCTFYIFIPPPRRQTQPLCLHLLYPHGCQDCIYLVIHSLTHANCQLPIVMILLLSTFCFIVQDSFPCQQRDIISLLLDLVKWLKRRLKNFHAKNFLLTACPDENKMHELFCMSWVFGQSGGHSLSGNEN